MLKAGVHQPMTLMPATATTAHAALKWTSGRPTRSALLTLPILAALSARSVARAMTVEEHSPQTDTPEPVTPTGVTSTPTDRGTPPSTYVDFLENVKDNLDLMRLILIDIGPRLWIHPRHHQEAHRGDPVPQGQRRKPGRDQAVLRPERQGL